MQPGATFVVVRLAVMTLPPCSTAPAVVGCRLVQNWLDVVSSSPPAATVAVWRGRGRVPIAGWSLGGVEKDRGLWEGGRRGRCEEWARRG
jgi:hypothetical protein